MQMLTIDEKFSVIQKMRNMSGSEQASLRQKLNTLTFQKYKNQKNNYNKAYYAADGDERSELHAACPSFRLRFIVCMAAFGIFYGIHISGHAFMGVSAASVTQHLEQNQVPAYLEETLNAWSDHLLDAIQLK